MLKMLDSPESILLRARVKIYEEVLVSLGSNANLFSTYVFFDFTESCPPIPPLSNGQIHNNSISYGALVSFSCDLRFQLKGLRQIKCLDGKWNGDFPSCKGSAILLCLFAVMMLINYSASFVVIANDF